ncbi:MAG: hypothetical protein ACOCZA_04490 [Spirochaetota bacterium]
MFDKWFGMYRGLPPVMGKFIELYSVELVWPLMALISLFSAGFLTLLYFIENRAKLKVATVE